jgi:intracellular septation protein
MQQYLKFFGEIVPLLLFFTAYKMFGLIAATATILVATILAQGITYYYVRKLSYVQLFAAFLLVLFGSITILSGNSLFIKLKPTIINGVFAIILLVGALMKKGLLKYVFNGALVLSEENWIRFSTRWAVFFLFLALLNEVIWRNVEESVWVNFKVFGILGLTLLFLFTQLPFLNKNMIKD